MMFDSQPINKLNKIAENMIEKPIEPVIRCFQIGQFLLRFDQVQN